MRPIGSPNVFDLNKVKLVECKLMNGVSPLVDEFVQNTFCNLLWFVHTKTTFATDLLPTGFRLANCSWIALVLHSSTSPILESEASRKLVRSQLVVILICCERTIRSCRCVCCDLEKFTVLHWLPWGRYPAKRIKNRTQNAIQKAVCKEYN